MGRNRKREDPDMVVVSHDRVDNVQDESQGSVSVRKTAITQPLSGSSVGLP